MLKRNIAVILFVLPFLSIVSKNIYCLETAQPTQEFERTYQESAVKGGDSVKEITYEQFLKIRNSGEKYILLDVLSSENYNKGHIEGSVSFPIETISKENAEKKLSKDSKIILYCASFSCHASTKAAKELSGWGYKVLDYKGGLKEWKDKGNQLVK